jgi:hypothetical protein
VPLQQL